jgi:hypothetical protein
MTEKVDGRNFGKGCLWGVCLSIPLWILVYFIVCKIYHLLS